MNKVMNKIGLAVLGLLFVQLVNAQQYAESDLKVNVQGINAPTEKIKNLEPVSFEYDTQKGKVLGLPEGNQYGFVANSVKNTMPEVVKEESKVYAVGKNSTKVARFDGVNNEGLIPLLVAAVKEQQLQIERLQQELDALKKK